ncbi:MAG TPA: MFS transporter [Nocardioides sp.]|uniref:MFS transporter n=1 Tax=uncultured Nocardioides sp. TaxID=198441 RepID=UPI00260848E0|nr:MFS transporter [uncultured Nocardioides sp.]HRD61282.1 MFS transporter [Nocardioides sp.]HRI95644.1 MFS transporter [Nocardioides sp.]
MSTLPAALAEPTVTPPSRWVALLALASVGLWAGFFGPIQVLLAQQAESLDPANKEQVLALVTGLGALVSVVCNPLAGAFSDRTTLRAGRRVPWLVGGALGGAAFLALLSVAPNVPVMVLAWCGVQATLNAMLAATTAVIPDQVPVDRRGRIGGIAAVAQTVGVVAGTGIAAATGSIAAGYLSIAVFLVVLAVPFALTSRDVALPAEARPPFELRTFVASFWISPRGHADFAWAWVTRFLVNLGNALGLLYLLYFLKDVLGFSSDEAEDRVFLLTALYAVTLLLTAVIFGIWSDRLGRRKVFVIWSGLVSGCAVAVLGIGQSWPSAVAAAVVMGCAYGIYTAVDFALITQVLPTATDRAKDLGVINIANALPQVVAPVLAGVLLAVVEASGGLVESDGDGFSVGYFAVYFLAFLASVLGSVFVTRIRGVR